ncbi:ferritin-like domain-containing protein [Methanococcus voltae]|uniref:Rubrerythrin n=2 Tax=Methanococcus voltae TaxID=2188 RepID=A0A8J7RG77_METVO|nr:ferritin family protein [Methanococcus voltae]MBP2171800.1 rubrerythrin [Methanococcus voltae]MBP2201262.1 rubrerythrin [Methanococcus voltae]MCS3922796.1 rubrerythrin [Methanococcus voltae PS]
MELVNEHKIGVSKDTPMEKEVMANFKGECAEVGMYLAMARQAQREGYPEIAEVLKTMAWEEAEHASKFAEMNEVIKPTLKENIEMMYKGEMMANKEKKAAADMAESHNLEHVHDFFEESSRDEARHAKMLKGILDRYLNE